MRRRDAMGLLGSTLGLAGCWSDTFTWNQKLTVVVQTPDGEISASAVTTVSKHVGTGGLTGFIMSHDFFGEAAVIRLNENRYIFALGLGKASTPWIAEQLFRDLLPQSQLQKSERENLIAKYGKLQELRLERTLPNDKIPAFAVFKDINDPMSISLVRPDEFRSFFGPGYALKNVKLEITDEDRTSSISQLNIPWLNEIDTQFVDWKLNPPNQSDYPLHDVTVRAFVSN